MAAPIDVIQRMVYYLAQHGFGYTDYNIQYVKQQFRIDIRESAKSLIDGPVKRKFQEREFIYSIIENKTPWPKY